MSCAHWRRVAGRQIAVCLVAAGSFLLVCTFPARATAKPTEREIQSAVDRAVAFLRRSLKGNDYGRTSLMVLALIKAGVPADSPDLQPIIEGITRRFNSEGNYVPGERHIENYEAGVTLMALANADPQKYRREIESLTRFLVERQGSDGDWDYATRTTGDTSISQYAILGLWEAARAGATVPRGVWGKAAGWHVTRQLPDGGFTYHPTRQVGVDAASHTMTVAGTSSLLVSRLHLYGDGGMRIEPDPPPQAAGRGKPGRKKFGLLTPGGPDDEEAGAEPAPAPVKSEDKIDKNTVRPVAIDKAIKQGRVWLDERFTITPGTTWQTYYLYGIERLAALADLQEIGGHNWYDEGAEFLVKNQKDSGGWEDNSGAVAATSLGIMFLVKATAKALNKPRRADPRFGGGLLVGGRGLPENLQEVQLDKGTVKVRKIKGPVEELLAELENVQSRKVESAQAALVDLVAIDNPEALIGQKDRLLKLVRDERVEARRTAYWALGRTGELRIVPVLIGGLLDPDLSCMVEARNALRYVSKKTNAIDLPDEPTEAQRKAAMAYWKKWYQGVRPYDERDDLGDSAKP